MTPRLSILVSVHNHSTALPTLFDSILCQSFKGLEVVVVDDASTEQYDGLLNAYRDKGLAIRFHASSRRLYTKDARLKAVELARGEILTFADADDVFLGTDILEAHVQKFLSSGCDVLHFRTVYIHQDGWQRNNDWADPFARELKGDAIFAAYAPTVTGHLMWNKLYSRQVWLRNLEVAKAIPITICSEDLFLSTWYLFHARHYIGSDLVGYAHGYADKTAVKSACRGVAFYIILRDLIPYLEAHGCPSPTLETLSSRLAAGCQAYINRACLEAVKNSPLDPAPYGKTNAFAEVPESLLTELLLYVNQRNATQLSSWARDFL